jgi:hypothetical protein
MRVRVITTLTICFALFFPNTIYAANPKAGATCSKQGASQVFAGKKYTCIKSGKKLVWNKGVIIKSNPTPTSSPSSTSTSNLDEEKIKVGDQCSSDYRGKTIVNLTGTFICKHDEISAFRWQALDLSKVTETPTPTPTIEKIDWSLTNSTDGGYKNSFNSWCEYEKEIPSQWFDLQKAHIDAWSCSGIYHLDKYVLGNQRPVSESRFQAESIETCKISDPENARNTKGFANNFESGRKSYILARRNPGPNTTIQLVPIFAEDTAKPVNSPEQDYGKYLDFLKEWIDYSSGGPSNVNIRIPENYLPFSGKVSSYKLFHENNQTAENHQRFNRDLVAQVDAKINFSGADLVYVVVPAGTPLANFEQGVLGELRTAEGIVPSAMSQYPYTLKDLPSVIHSNFLLPYWWLHESYHGTIGFDDHYPSGQSINMGGWSLLSTWGGDMLAWEKWILGLITDDQVYCIQPNSGATTWLAPSSVKSSAKKMTVVPISKYKAIVIESIRAAGLYYKIPSSSHGVLVYELDLLQVEHGGGMSLVLPKNRNTDKGPFKYGEATLRRNESVVSNGFKITVLESGNFGDVVKVEKA